MKTKSCKAKGRLLQKKIAEDILNTFPELTPDDVASRPMSQPGEDVMMSKAAKEKIPFSFEAKNTERFSAWAAFEQAKRNSEERRAVVVAKRNGSEPLCLMEWSTALEMMRVCSKERLSWHGPA